MLNGKPILIVEDEALIALHLAAIVREAGGIVVGPSATVQRAFALLEEHDVDAAIVDATLADRDVTPLALELHAKHIPFVVHTATGVPQELADALPGAPVIIKPAGNGQIVATLTALIAK